MTTRRTSRFAGDTQYALRVEGTRIEFECKNAGHRYWEDFGPDRKRGQIATPLIARFARYWSRENGGCSGECPACRRAARKAERQARSA